MGLRPTALLRYYIREGGGEGRESNTFCTELLAIDIEDLSLLPALSLLLFFIFGGRTVVTSTFLRSARADQAQRVLQ